MAGCASGDPTTQRGVLKGLWKVAQRQAVLRQLALKIRAEGSRLDARRAGYWVDLEYAIQSAQVDRDGAVVARADVRRDSSDDRGASAERDRRDALTRAPLEHTLQVILIARVGNKVGGVIEVPAKPAHDVRVGLAQRVRRARVGVAGADVRQRGRSGGARRRQR